MATVESLLIKVAAQGTKTVSREMDNLAKSTKGVGDKSKEAGEEGSRFGKFFSTDVSDGVKKASAAILGAVAALGILSIKITAANDLINKQAQALGVDTEALSELAFAFKRGGVDSAGMNTAIRTLTRVISEADEGVGEYVDTVAKLGIQTTDAQGNLLAFDELLPQIADRFKDMEDGTAKGALALELFGRQGQKMIPVLNEGAAGIKKLRDRANELGATITQDVADQATQFQDSLTDMKTAAGGLANELSFVVTPAFNFWSDQIATLLPKMSMLRQQMNGLRNDGDPLSESLGALSDQISKDEKEFERLQERIKALSNVDNPKLKEELILLQERFEFLNKRLTTNRKKIGLVADEMIEGRKKAKDLKDEITGLGKEAEIAIPIVRRLGGIIDTFADNPPPPVTIIDKEQVAADVIDAGEDMDAFNEKTIERIRLTNDAQLAATEAQTAAAALATEATNSALEITRSITQDVFDGIAEGGTKTDKIVAKLGSTIVDTVLKIITTQAAQTTASVANAATTGTAVAGEMAVITTAATPAAVTTAIATEGGSAAAGAAGVLAAVAAIVPAIAGIFVGDEGFIPQIKSAVGGRRSLGIFQDNEGVLDAKSTGSIRRGTSLFEAAASRAVGGGGSRPETMALQVENITIGETLMTEGILKRVDVALRRGDIG